MTREQSVRSAALGHALAVHRAKGDGLDIARLQALLDVFERYIATGTMRR